MEYFLGIDNGGTVTKAALYDRSGVEVACMSVNTPLKISSKGYQQRDMEELWEANLTVIRQTVDRSGVDPADIRGVGCTGHGKGLYLWGKDDKPAYPGIASTDRRAEQIIHKWKKNGVSEKAERTILQPLIACQPAALLRWVKENEPDVVSNIKWIFECKDYIRFRLTGQAAAELTDYSGSGLLNLQTGNFDPGLMKLYGIEELYECLPPICLSYDNCGAVSKEVSRLTGLWAGTPVCGGMFDIDACAIAMDISSPDKLCVITGTWSINEYISRQPVEKDDTTRNSLFCIPGYYLIEESSPTSAGNLDWFLKNCMKWERAESSISDQSFYARIDELVRKLSPEDSDIIFLPFLYGSNVEGCSEAVFAGLNNSHGVRHMLRAIYEGVAFSHLYHIEKLLRFRSSPDAIRMAGGAVNSSVWVQMFADVIGLPVEVVNWRELGTLGSAMAATVASGIYADYPTAARHMVSIKETVVPDRSRLSIYRKKYNRYKRIAESLSKCFLEI